MHNIKEGHDINTFVDDNGLAQYCILTMMMP
jgi:DNA-directed RNA polymerase subunit N (RpoN/RPB10)